MALVAVFHHAPPTLQTCRLGFAPVVDSPDAEQTWKLYLEAGFGSDAHNWNDIPPDYCPASQFACFFERAATLAKHLQPHAAEASIEVQVDKQSQEVILTRNAAA